MTGMGSARVGARETEGAKDDAATVGSEGGGVAWRPMATAPKDGTPVLLKHKPVGDDERCPGFNNIVFVGTHEGHTPSGYDMGWSFRAPVGYGGIPDISLVGWLPCPDAETFRLRFPSRISRTAPSAVSTAPASSAAPTASSAHERATSIPDSEVNR